MTGGNNGTGRLALILMETISEWLRETDDETLDGVFEKRTGVRIRAVDVAEGEGCAPESPRPLK